MFLLASALLIIGSAFGDQSCSQNDMCGAGEKCYDGECTVSDGPGNMCGGPSDTDACFECFECNNNDDGCVPISDCAASVCEEDEDCERGQICYNNDCALPDKIPGGCTGKDVACDGLEFFECKVELNCRWDDDYDNAAGRDSKRKGGKGSRGGGGRHGSALLSMHAGMASLSPFNIASLESEQKGLSFDVDGNVEYDEDGHAVLTEYAEMCGGRNADEECYECFECSSGGSRCVPVDGCVPSCDVDDDCTREQICVADEWICQLPGGRPESGYRDDDDEGMDSKRKGGKGNRGDDQPLIARDTINVFTIASLEAEQKGISYDADGAVEYDDDGHVVLTEYAEMCGGRNADEECYECFQCSSGGSRCIPVDGCVPSCEVDDDCTREQICVAEEWICQLPGGRPESGYRDDDGSDSKRKGGKGNRGDSDEDEEVVVVMKNGMFAMEASEESSKSVSYFVLLWCSIAAVLLFAVASLVRYWNRAVSAEKNDGSSAKSSHLVIDGQVYF